MSQPPKVVLFVDGDATLSQQVGGSLRRHGLTVELLGDGNDLMGRREAPSLIILCIDPPKPSGWSLVSRLKKSPVLKAVPLIVTSAEATEADFEAHRKLQVRADFYLRKPYNVASLLEKVGDFTGGLSVDASDEDEDLIIDLEPGTPKNDPPPPNLRLDDKDADAVLSALNFGGGDVGAAAPAPTAPATATATAAVPRPAAMEVTRPVPVVPAPPVGLKAASPDELAKLRDERDRLKKELDEERAKPRTAAPGGTASGPVSRDRELLSLREVINKKEKELLNLRDSLDAKDRLVLDQKDKVRELERARGDLDERLLAMERELVEAQERSEVLAVEREAIQRQAEEAMRAAERGGQELAALQAKAGADLDGERREAASQLAALESKRAEAQKLADERAAELTRREEALNDALETHSNERLRLERELEEAVRSVDERRAAEVAEAVKAHEIAIAAVEEKQRALAAELQASQQTNAQLQGRIQREESTVTRARKALAIALTLLENGTPPTGSST